jgi:hypothetical protein
MPTRDSTRRSRNGVWRQGRPSARILRRRCVGGMRLSAYLPTRVLELTVHSLDLADALSVGFDFPAAAVDQTLTTLTQVGALTGQAPVVIRLLTGRGGSPASLL